MDVLEYLGGALQLSGDTCLRHMLLGTSYHHSQLLYSVKPQVRHTLHALTLGCGGPMCAKLKNMHMLRIQKLKRVLSARASLPLPSQIPELALCVRARVCV